MWEKVGSAVKGKGWESGTRGGGLNLFSQTYLIFVERREPGPEMAVLSVPVKLADDRLVVDPRWRIVTEDEMAADEDFTLKDQRMNACYKELMAQLKPPQKEKVIAAQRAWIAYRDAHCESLTSATPTLIFRAKARLTQTRLEELQSLIPDLKPPSGD